MGLFTKNSLPATSYGYVPPREATAHGWHCPGFECGATEHEPVRRWPKPCPQCGSDTDPLFDEPWEHEAEGTRLRWLVLNHPDQGGGFYEDQWHIWQFKDALLQGERQQALVARSAARAHALARIESDPWWGPGAIYFHLVWYDLKFDHLDWAADDLLAWFAVSSTQDVESNNTNRTNSRQVIDMTGSFLDAGGASHPRTPEIKAACLAVAESAFPILNRDLQAVVARVAQM